MLGESANRTDAWQNRDSHLHPLAERERDMEEDGNEDDLEFLGGTGSQRMFVIMSG